jgi:hypothetical protein
LPFSEALVVVYAPTDGGRLLSQKPKITTSIKTIDADNFMTESKILSMK